MSSGLTETMLNAAFALLVSKIFLLTATLTAIHTNWKILLCTLDFFLPFKFMIGEQSKRRIIGLSA